MQTSSKIYIAGHRGLVGSALLRKLQDAGYTNIVTATSAELDLRRQADVEGFFAEHRPDYVFLQLQKSAVSWRIIRTKPISSTKI